MNAATRVVHVSALFSLALSLPPLSRAPSRAPSLSDPQLVAFIFFSSQALPGPAPLKPRGFFSSMNQPTIWKLKSIDLDRDSVPCLVNVVTMLQTMFSLSILTGPAAAGAHDLGGLIKKRARTITVALVHTKQSPLSEIMIWVASSRRGPRRSRRQSFTPVRLINWAA